MIRDTTDRPTRNAARAALLAFGVIPKRLASLAHRHNDVFRVDTQNGGTYVLRIQNDVMDDAAARSQLLWMQSLAENTDISVPRPLVTLDGAPFIRVPTPRGLCRAVLLTWVRGRRARTRGPGVFRAAARLVARMHLHAETFRPPRGFICRTLDADWLFGRRFFARRAEAKPWLGRQDRKLLARVERFVTEAMNSTGRGPKQFGVIHADLGLQNLCFDHGQPSPIDFDEFGRGWYLFDLAELFRTSVNPRNYHERKQLAIEAYESVRPLGERAADRFDAFMIATHVQYLNWAFEHARNKRDLRWTGFCLEVISMLCRTPPA